MSSESGGFSVKRLFAIVCCLGVVAGVAAEQTWKTVDQMSTEDRALFDPATATPRDAEFPYMPAERYPFEPPYTAEELGYRSAEFPHISRWPGTTFDIYGVITSSGYMNQGETIFYLMRHYGFGLEGYLYEAVGGQVESRWMTYDLFPPKNEGTQQFWTPYRTDAEFRTKMDYFIYSPQLRRVRRFPAPRRDQRFPDNAQTFDDVIGRDPWEFDWALLGTDVLYETVRFPNTRPTITLNRGDAGFVERSTDSLKLMGDDFSLYRTDGGVACWVITAKPRDEWLPGYREGMLILWLEKTTFFPLRQEKYDRDGKLMTIEVRLANHQIPERGPFGYTGLLTVYWNITHDLISYSFHDPQRAHDWTEEEEKMIFTAEFMRRDWLVEPMKSEVRILDPDTYYMRPHLQPEKFPQVRDVSLPSDLAARVKAQNQAGHLIFETGAAETDAASD